MTRTSEKTGSMTTAEIRAAFLDYFASKGHRIAPSAPLVPWQDPTLLFVNAGMVPFKDMFTGAARADSPRAASSQRCLRVSGKHNDLEEVGRTPRHHTLFEMLGNFSFGDYFKERAIELAWELLVDRLKLDPARLAITVFGGEKGVSADDEAAELWRRISGLPSERILRFGWKDNFWTMGETGPCGPCSEIHYDLGADLPGAVNDGARWMEIWNLVFMQYERDASGILRALPAPSIDTGMGLERITSVVQGKRSNYDTDLFVQLLGRIAQVAGRTYDGGPGDDAVSMRVIADHVRAVAFLFADDVAPDRVGRGYVLRKILRRAVSHGVLLGVARPFLADVADGVVDLMGDAHPVLRERQSAIRRGCEQEESLYRRTVEEGMRRIDDLLEQLEDDSIWLKGEAGARVLKGDVAFRLYDTYGCPLELTASVGVRRGFSVDETGFQAAMEVQKERSREHWRGAGAGKGAADAFVASQASALAAPTRFTGYGSLAEESDVAMLAVVHDGALVPADRAGEGAVVAIATGATPFYGESGGQIGDAGVIEAGGARVAVEDVRRFCGGEIFLHFGTVEAGEIARGSRVRLAVDPVRRREIAAHHSATHLAHYALREILGTHVQQKGSYVGSDRLRFDFSHTQAVAGADLDAIESRVNELARANFGVLVETMPLAKAKEAGALAFFGDKYGDIVRVVTMGPSKELCGGTHLAATGEMGLFALSGEGSVASGVRRVEAFAGPAALAHARAARERLALIAARLKSSPEETVEKVDEILRRQARLEKRIEELEREAARGAGASLANQAVEVRGMRVVAGRAPVDSRDQLRDLADEIRLSAPKTVVVLGAVVEDKVALAAALSDDVVKSGKLKAGDLVGHVARIVGGGGGGKPHLATAGGKDPAKLDEALASVPSIVSNALSGEE